MRGLITGNTRTFGPIFLAMFLWTVMAFTGCGRDITGDAQWNSYVKSCRHDRDMGGYDLHYIDMGKGTPILMVHGFADSSYTWHGNARFLVGNGFRVILADQPGMGRSGIPPAPYRYSVENQAGELLKLMKGLGIGRFVMAGHSMGGGMALYVSSRHPELIIKTIVVDPLAYPPGGILLTALPGMEHVTAILVNRWGVKQGLKGVYWDDSMVTDPLVDEYARFLDKPGYMKVISSLTRDFVSEEFRATADNYPSLKPPLLIIWGARDTWIPPKWGRRLHGETAGSRLVTVPEAGHCPHQEQALTVNREMLSFLKSP